MKKICPNDPEHIMFVATAVVAQLWIVGGDGEMIEVIDDCLDIIQEPQKNTMWQCLECGSVAEDYKLRIVSSPVEIE